MIESMVKIQELPIMLEEEVDMLKVTIKILDGIHRKLRMVQAILGVKTLGDAIEHLCDDFIELHNRKK